MALVIHIAVALMLYWWRAQRPGAAQPGPPPTGPGLVKVYLVSLFTLVVFPYTLAELLRHLVHIGRDQSSLVLLLPHFYMLLIRKEILAYLLAHFKPKS